MGGHFDITGLESSVNELKNKLNDSSIWNNASEANKVNIELSSKSKKLDTYRNLETDILVNIDILDELKANYDDDTYNLVLSESDDIESKLKDFEIETLLTGEYDKNNCYLEIHPGAGGTEAQDWADMLLRMYTMFFDKNGYRYEIVDKEKANDAGIKSVLIRIEHEYAYGYLKGEIGVHRLVRISPFDSAKRRHTSFAAVNVTPEIDEVTNVDIKDEDIRIDIFRSSGNGGQGVNTTDSAVRITHIPTGIVVSIQNERSQIKNKDIAISILKSKLLKIEIDKREAELNALKGKSNIDFGSQIRNYILEPYSLVKDLRTNYESNNPDAVLDGDLLPFIESFIRER